MNTVSHIEDDSKIRKTYSQLDLKALIKHTVRSDGWSVTKGFQPETKQLWVWCVGGEDIPTPLQDTYDITAWRRPFGDERRQQFIILKDNMPSLLSLAVNGYKYKIPDNDNVIIMILESATPGRLSITTTVNFHQTIILTE